ncbi:TolC family protein [Coprobacter tertius]|uniref:TolC family protein n=1 Tax=Coprobacter tertius TaxID=2944915 RepID=A0ABT1MI15_9BACT|nr:TolC family protein [Coprobacter tertius]MCP9612046.1 TolC family protein [Coprobacter tertius]
MKRKFLVFIIFSVIIDLPAQNKLSLQDCIDRALDANYGIRIARNEQQINRNNYNVSDFLPVVSASGTQKQSNLNRQTKADGGSSSKGKLSDSFGAGVGLDWTLFDGLAMFTSRERNKELITSGELRTRLAIENLIAQVSTEYYKVLVQQYLLEAARQSLNISIQRYEIARQKNNIGSISGLEFKQTKIDLNTDSSSFVKQQELVKSAYISLNTLMNENLGNTGYVKDSIELLPMLSEEEIYALMLENNTTLLLAKQENRLSELDVKLARSAYFPIFDFSAGYSFSRTSTPDSYSTFNQTTGPYWGFSLNIPIFNRLDTKRKIKNAEIVRENTMLTYKDAELQMRGNLAQLYNTYQNNLLMVNFENESALVALTTMTAALDRYRLGNLSGIEFREFQRSYLDAVSRKVNAEFQAKSSEISLLLISGRL